MLVALALIALVGLALLSSCRRAGPSAPTPTPTPFIAPTPPPAAADAGLGPAPVTSLDFVHQPFGDGACGVCHDLDSPDPTKLWGSVETVCRDCHWQDVPDPDKPIAHPHEPFEQGQCIECHTPHAGAYPNLLVAPVQQLCNDCHRNEGLATMAQPHPSVAQGECNLCHLSHGSEQPAILRDTQPKLCGSCHTDQTDPLVSMPAHASDPNMQCSACHAPHDPASSPVVLERDLCIECHEDLPAPASFDYPHAPYAEGRCADCHPGFHKGADAPLLAETQAESCNKCHQDHGETINQPHPSVAAGECRLCHDGHGSDFANHLNTAEADLCETCHKEPFDKNHTFAAHAADKLPACTTCHSPHEPKTSGKAVAVACDSCHQDILLTRTGSAHTPVTGGECTACHPQFHGDQPGQLAAVQNTCTDCHKPETGSISHPPYNEGDCTSCHSPHSSAYGSLLAKAPSQLCGACHASQAATFRSSGHVTKLRDQCAACHQAHNGNIDNLLLARTNALCDSCHKDLPHGFHPVTGKNANGEQLSCISCHAPHGSQHPSDLRAGGDALCLSCHDFNQPLSPTARK